MPLKPLTVVDDESCEFGEYEVSCRSLTGALPSCWRGYGRADVAWLLVREQSSQPGYQRPPEWPLRLRSGAPPERQPDHDHAPSRGASESPCGSIGVTCAPTPMLLARCTALAGHGDNGGLRGLRKRGVWERGRLTRPT